MVSPNTSQSNVVSFPGLDPPDLPRDIANCRQLIRQLRVSAHYNGVVHLLFVISASLFVIAFSVWMLDGTIENDWGTIPITFVVANFVEYFGHRYPMHHRIPGMTMMFRRHAMEHHQFFTDRWMTCRSSRDFKLVLFSPVLLFFFLGVVATPVGTLLFFVARPNIAWLYVATAMFYFLQYESLHFCYHLDDRSWIAKLPVIRWLREHHRVHHSKVLMTECNFNVTWPIADFVFRTFRRELKEKPIDVDSTRPPAANSPLAECGSRGPTEGQG